MRVFVIGALIAVFRTFALMGWAVLAVQQSRWPEQELGFIAGWLGLVSLWAFFPWNPHQEPR